MPDWSTPKGFCFINHSSGFPSSTPPTNCEGIYMVGGSAIDYYPTNKTIGGQTVVCGYITGKIPYGGYNLDSTAGKLAGCHRFQYYFPAAEFRVDLPAAGTYKVRVAMGASADYGPEDDGQTFEILDNTTSKLAHQGDITTVNYFMDAAGVIRTSQSDWNSNNTQISLTFSGTVLILKFSNVNFLEFGNMSYLELEQVLVADTAITGGTCTSSSGVNAPSPITQPLPSPTTADVIPLGLLAQYPTTPTASQAFSLLDSFGSVITGFTTPPTRSFGPLEDSLPGDYWWESLTAVTGDTIASGSAVHAPTSIQVLNGATCTPTSQVYLPAVGHQQAITGAFIGGTTLPAQAAYWNFNEGSGSTAADSSGNGRTITKDATASWTTSNQKFGAAALTRAANASVYADWGTFSSINLGTTNSISFWVKVATYGGGIVSDGVFGWLALDLTGGLVWYSYASDAYWTTGVDFTTGLHHIVVTRSGQTFNCYVDGVSQGQFLSGDASNTWALSKLGAYGTGASAGFAGVIDDLRLYTVELTSGEAATLYAYNPDSPGGGASTYPPTVALTSGQSVTGTTLASTAGANPPVVAAGDVAVLGTTLGTGVSVRVPTVTVGAATVLGTTLVTGNIVRVPTIFPGPVTGSGATIGTASQPFAPLLVSAGAVTVIGTVITTTAAVTEPLVTLGATGVTIGSGSQLFEPAVGLTITVDGATITNVSTLYPPTRTTGILFTLTEPLFVDFSLEDAVLGRGIVLSEAILVEVPIGVFSEFDRGFVNEFLVVEGISLNEIELGQIITPEALFGEVVISEDSTLMRTVAVDAFVRADVDIGTGTVLWFDPGIEMPGLKTVDSEGQITRTADGRMPIRTVS